MDNHLKLITHLCQRDGLQTSGLDNPPLLPTASLKHSTKCCRKTYNLHSIPGVHGQLCRPTLGNKCVPGREAQISVWSFSTIQDRMHPPLPSPSPQERNFILKSDSKTQPQGSVMQAFYTFNAIHPFIYVFVQ